MPPEKYESKINEVSMKTLGNYIKKRTADIASAGSLMTGDYGIGPAEKKAKREAKKVPIEIVRFRMKEAKKEGLSYQEYCDKYRLHRELSSI